jgi:hypothetical protein
LTQVFYCVIIEISGEMHVNIYNNRKELFIASGIVVQFALEAAERLEKDTGAKIRVVDMHTIKPIDEAAVLSAARTGRVIAAQDHNIIGGLGYYAAAVIAQAGISSQYKILGCPDRFVPIATAPYLFHVNEYDADGLYKNMNSISCSRGCGRSVSPRRSRRASAGAVNMVVHGAEIFQRLRVPYGLVYLLRREVSARLTAQKLQYRILVRREQQVLPAAVTCLDKRFQQQRPGAARLVRADAAPAEQRLDAQQQLVRKIGLGEIIVAAGAQAVNNVLVGVERAEEEDAAAVVAAAERPAVVQPVAVRQQDVQNGQVGLYFSVSALPSASVSAV